MNEQKHIINREIIELKVRERVHAQSIQNRASEIVRSKLNPALDRLFSRISDKDEIIRIDKLVIDLGTITEVEIENEFIEKVISGVRDQINRLLISSPSIVNKSNGNSTAPAEKVSGVSVINRATDVLAQFVYFLEYGYFPWWGKSVNDNESSVTNANKKIFKEVLNIEKSLLKNSIVPLLGKINVRKRLVYQFNRSYLYELCKKLDARLFENYTARFDQLQSCAGSSQITKLLTISFYDIVFQWLNRGVELDSKRKKINFIKEILQSALAEQPEKEKETILAGILQIAQQKPQDSKSSDSQLIIIAVVETVTEFFPGNQLFSEMIQKLSLNNDSVINAIIKQAVKKNGKVESLKNRMLSDKNIYDSPVLTEKSGLNTQNENLKFKQEEESKGKYSDNPMPLLSKKPDMDKEQIVVFNAGLVLIHPFLRYFFEGLILLNTELQFKGEAEAFKAVHLLQFIATGAESATEANLPLNKILCGLDVTEPVPLNVSISDEDKDECLFLIKTVLERWEALKTTNPAALRDTYLQREGILKKSGQSWSLTIERNTFDVMLERLPWSYSLVKLPWCRQILNVEW